MKNRWTIERALATWRADLSKFAFQPDVLLNWIEFVWKAGSELEVFLPSKKETIQYIRPSDCDGYDPELMKRIRSNFAATNILDVFHDHSTGIEFGSSIAFFENHGIAEAMVLLGMRFLIPMVNCLPLRSTLGLSTITESPSAFAMLLSLLK